MTLIKPEHLRSLPGPDNVIRTVLDNGIVVLARENESSPSVVFNGYLSAGSMFDPPGKLGRAYFTAASLMRGTSRREFQQIYNELETAGASVGFGASVHNVSFGGRGLSEDLPLLLDLFSECLREPVFPLEQIERLRAQMMTGFAIRAQDTEDMASLTFDKLLFKEHPYGMPEDGYPETIAAISQADLVEFHRQQYGPQGMVVVIVGAIRPQTAVDMVESILGDWRNPAQLPQPEFPAPEAPQEAIREHVSIAGKTQVDLVMGVLGPRRSDAHFLAASLGNNILGQFGMMGRIGEVVREKAGLAYSAATSLNAWISSGSWEISAGVNPVNVERTIDLIIKEITRFIDEPVSAEELHDSQANYIGRLPLSMESNAGMASSILSLERFQLGLDYLRRYPYLVEAITPADVLETARMYFDPTRFVTVSAGPESV